LGCEQAHVGIRLLHYAKDRLWGVHANAPGLDREKGLSVLGAPSFMLPKAIQIESARIPLRRAAPDQSTIM
jgi:hypothetical protein